MGFFNWADMRYTVNGKGVENKRGNGFNVFFGVLARKLWKFIILNITYLFVGSPSWAFMSICTLSFLQFHAGNPDYNRFIPYLLPLILLIAFISSPATIGVTFILRNFSREEHAWVPGDLFDKASKNYRQGVIIGFINSIAAFLLLYAYYYYSQVQSMIVISYLLLALGVIFLMMRMYIYPLAVSYSLSIKNIYRYSLVLVIMKLPQNLLILSVCFGILYAGFSYLAVGIFLSVIILISLLGYITNFYTDRVIIKNIQNDNIKEYEEK